MKTTLILRDDLVRRAKARAALRGQPLSRYMEESLERTLAEEEANGLSSGDWLAKLPQLSKAARRELQTTLEDPNLRAIDEEMWR